MTGAERGSRAARYVCAPSLSNCERSSALEGCNITLQHWQSETSTGLQIQLCTFKISIWNRSRKTPAEELDEAGAEEPDAPNPENMTDRAASAQTLCQSCPAGARLQFGYAALFQHNAVRCVENMQSAGLALRIVRGD